MGQNCAQELVNCVFYWRAVKLLQMLQYAYSSFEFERVHLQHLQAVVHRSPPQKKASI